MSNHKTNWTAIAAMIIALCSLAISVWEGYETRKNYRLSVFPKLEFLGSTQKHGPVALELKNKGLGPAIVKSYRVLFSNSLIFDSVTMKDYDSVKLKELLRQGGIGGDYTFFVLTDSSAILPGDSITIFSFISNDTTAFHGHGSVFSKAIDQFKVHIEYSSIYGDQYVIDTYE